MLLETEAVAQRTNIPITPVLTPPRVSASSPVGGATNARKRAFAGWWAVGSVAFGSLGAAFLPAAILGGGDWGSVLYSVFPLWSICCGFGVASGIRGMMVRRIPKGYRLMAVGGAVLSLSAFAVLTLVALIGGS